MTYYDKYHCINCPVERFCGTVVAATRLCHSLDDSIAGKEAAHVLTLSKTTTNTTEEDYIEGKVTMWDNMTD